MIRNVFRIFRKKLKISSPAMSNSDFLSDLEILRNNRDSCSWPGIYYGNVDLLAKLVGAKKILEVGVAWGYHAEHLLLNLPSVTYTGIDPYLSDYDKNDAFPQFVAELFHDENQPAMDRLYEAVKLGLDEKFPGRSTIVRKKSTIWIHENSEKFDVIFLDGDHTYATVRTELPLYWEALNKGGVLAGDDYDWPEVKRAVDEFTFESKLEIRFLSKESRGYPTYFFVK
jgi:hypothetical protein